MTTGMRPDGRGAARSVDLDDVGRRLLRILQADGRTSYATTAPQVGLSAPAVRLRVQRLVDAGIL